MLILGIVAFNLIVSPTRIHEKMSCVLIQNMREGSIEIIDDIRYEFSFVAGSAFYQILNVFPEQKDKIKQPIDLKVIFSKISVFTLQLNG